MNYSRINHYQDEYNIGYGKAYIDTYNGLVKFSYPLLSIGMNTFQIDTSLVYNSDYSNTDFNGKKIGLGNGWKLNFHPLPSTICFFI